MKLNTAVDLAAQKTISARDQNNAGGVTCAVLMPHAPIIVPAVGGERGHAAAASCQAMRDAAACVVRQRPDAVVLVSPHSPRQQRAFGIWGDNPMHGSFDQFNVPHEIISLPLDSNLAHTIAAESRTRNLSTWTIHRCPLDHGALVPLWFLVEAGWTGPAVVLSLNYPEEDGLIALGEAIAAAAARLSCRIALVASGDMSHRLTPGAPCGFHPQARRFDETFIQLVRTGEYGQIKTITPKLRERAAEDVVDSTLVAAAAVNWQSNGHQVLNYEGPFGVGYGVAILFTEKNSGSSGSTAARSGKKQDGTVLPGVARRSVTKALLASPEAAPEASGDYLNASRGVFVTIRQQSGALRGCVGTIRPATSDIVAETWRNARLAAFHDKRFKPVTQSELEGLRFEVSVLHPPETVGNVSDLDPGRYGIIVSVDDGRRGLLLPGIKEIKTPEEQLRLAREKGWINPDEPAILQRFQVDYFEEPI